MVTTKIKRLPFTLALVSCLTLGAAVALGAQETGTTRAAQAFDTSRVLLMDTTRFRPFNVSDTRALREALDDGAVHEDTPLLVLEHAGGTLALLVEQMAYHHVAQGDIAGEPWMVSF